MLSRISKKQFLNKLKLRKHESLETIRLIEASLLKNRGYVFKKSKKGDPVILLLSGGLDSIISWGVLMEEFGLNVYPLSIDRKLPRSLKEKRSIEYFSKFYKNRYPHLYHQPIRFISNIKKVQPQTENTLQNIHPEVILKSFNGKSTLTNPNFSINWVLLLPIYASLYSEYLYLNNNLNIKTIYCSVMPEDGLTVKTQTFTSLRSIMYFLCTATGHFNWQFSSVGFEKETGYYITKRQLIRWAHNHKIPVEKTWSCNRGRKYHCGESDCSNCFGRKKSYYAAKVTDKTIYKFLKDQTIIGFIVSRANSLKKKLKSL